VGDIEKQQRLEIVMKRIAISIDDVIKEEFGEMGFALLVFDFYKPGIANYISNAQRKGMIKSLRETADKLEARESIPVVGNNNIQ
jgi:hypothetical protein